MEWDAFGPLVLPFAPTCSAPLMAQHVRLAAIGFFGHTKAWRADLEPLDADGVLTSFAMGLPDDSQVEKLLKVVVTDEHGNRNKANVRTQDYGEDIELYGSQEILAWTPDRVALKVLPVQATGSTIVATVALKPSLTATTLPDDLFALYGQHIAKGALSTLQAMADKPWTDQSLARLHYVEFNNAKAVISRQVERGFAKSGRRAATRWF